MLLFGTAFAQTAKVQIIHNSPDATVSEVDIYVNGSAAITNLGFREATAFVDVPIDAVLGVAVAGSPAVIPLGQLNLTSGESYVYIAQGILPTSTGYDASVQTANGGSIDFELVELAPADTSAMAGMIDIAPIHGGTDADTVDLLANGNLLVDNLAYGDPIGYASVPATEYLLQITPYNDNSTIVASYLIDLAPLAGEGVVVFASGFLNPANNNGGAAFGLFAVGRAGGAAIEIPAITIGNARAQVIHNSADPDAATVDVYVDLRTDTVKFDDFAFRTASAFTDLPSGYEINITIAGPTSADITDGAIASFPATLEDGKTYSIVANGVVGTGFASNPDNVDSSFTLLINDAVREAAITATNTDLLVLHGATDAPSVGVNANGNAVIPSATYKQFAPYLEVPATEYRIDVTAANDEDNVLLPYYVDLEPFEGAALTVVASGFLTPSANNGGEGFALVAYGPAGGNGILLQPVGTARGQVIHNAADLAAATVDIYINTLSDTIFLDDFNFRDATPFVDLPTHYEVDVVINGPASTGIGDANVTTISATFESDSTYYIVANGLVDATNYQTDVNDPADIAFTLLVDDEAREAAEDASMFDLKVLHGATDAPSVDITANGGLPAIVSDLVYGEFNGYLSLMPASYAIGVGANPVATVPDDIIATFTADISGAAGGAGLVLASGFLTPADDPTGSDEGPAFGLLFVQPNGDADLLPVATNLRDLVQNNGLISFYPNPATESALLTYEVKEAGDVNVALFDIQGRSVFQQTASQLPGAYEMEVPVSKLVNGVHTLIVTTESTRSVMRVMVAN